MIRVGRCACLPKVNQVVLLVLVPPKWRWRWLCAGCVESRRKKVA